MLPTYWTNWAKTQGCFTVVRKPCTSDELVRVVRRTLERGPLRVAGASASWSPLVPTEGTIIDVSRLNRVLNFEPAPSNRVTVEPGVTIEALTAYLAKRGYSLECPTLFPKPTIGGAIAAGCHGTGTFWPPFSDSVLGLELIDGTGQIRTIDETDPVALSAARVSLGLLGVIKSVTLRIRPDFALDVYVRQLDVDDTMANLSDLLASHEYVFFMGFPFEKNLWARLANRSSAPYDPYTLAERVTEQLDAAFEVIGGKYAMPYLARNLPEYTPLMLSVANAISVQTDHDVERASREMHFQKGYPRAVTMSFSIPLPEASTAWTETDRIVRWFRARGMYPVNMAYVARFVGASTSYLSPAYGRDSCFFEVTTAVETPDQDEFFIEAWKTLSAIPGARPHWAKRWEEPFDPSALYPKFADFKTLQASLDPDRRFLNGWLNDLGF
ncbi:MAG: D-arabinono-1,4-lactone oxidase [Polyangiales bacterium]|nr:FAD-binding protein [Myxococcales bacterium]